MCYIRNESQYDMGGYSSFCIRADAIGFAIGFECVFVVSMSVLYIRIQCVEVGQVTHCVFVDTIDLLFYCEHNGLLLYC